MQGIIKAQQKSARPMRLTLFLKTKAYTAIRRRKDAFMVRMDFLAPKGVFEDDEERELIAPVEDFDAPQPQSLRVYNAA